MFFYLIFFQKQLFTKISDWIVLNSTDASNLIVGYSLALALNIQDATQVFISLAIYIQQVLLLLNFSSRELFNQNKKIQKLNKNIFICSFGQNI